MTDLDDALVEALTPLVRNLVREEVKRAKFEFAWVNVKQASEILGVSENAIYQRIHRGRLPVRRQGARVFIDLNQLDRQLRSEPPVKT